MAYEVLARSRLFGLEMPKDMFGVAQQLNLEVELSMMLRWEGVQVTRAMSPSPHLFLNTHPRELPDPKLGPSLETLRENWPDQPLTLEIHEAAVTKGVATGPVRVLLKRLDIKLAYDDFGVGQSRLNDLAEVAPDYVKFDMSLIRDIDTAIAATAAGRCHVRADGPQPGHPLVGRRRGNRGRERDLLADGL